MVDESKPTKTSKVLKRTLDKLNKSSKLTGEKGLDKNLKAGNRIKFQKKIKENFFLKDSFSNQLKQQTNQPTRPTDEQLKDDSYFKQSQNQQSDQNHKFNQQNNQQNNRQNNLIIEKDQNYLNLNSIKPNELNLIESTQQMEDLNGIFLTNNQQQEENMHLLNDIFSDDLFSSILDSKNKTETSYELNQDDEIQYNLDNPLANSLNDLNHLDNLDNLNSFSTFNQTIDQNNNKFSNQIRFFSTNSMINKTEIKKSTMPMQFFPLQPSSSTKLVKTTKQNNFYNLVINQKLNPESMVIDQNGKPSANLNKQNRKKIKNQNNQPKKKTIKFHEYKGPSSLQKQHSQQPSQQQLKETLENKPDRLKEHQTCLQKQLLSQINTNSTKTTQASSEIKKGFLANNQVLNGFEDPEVLNGLFKNKCPDKQEKNLGAFSLAPVTNISELNVKDVQLENEKSKIDCHSMDSENIFRYSPTKEQLNENAKDQFNLNSAQLTPPYQQQSTNQQQLNKSNNETSSLSSLTPLNELKIEKLEELKVQDLKVYLKKHNLQVSGAKISLVERLKNYILKNKTVTQGLTATNIQQLTPPNTPMNLDQQNNDQNSDSDDTKYTNPYNGTTKIFVNNNSAVPHFQTASISLNGYTLQPNNQFQFQTSQTFAPTTSSNQLNSTKLTNPNSSFTTLPLASIQSAQQIHFLSGPNPIQIATNSTNTSQQLNQLTVHQQLTPALVTPILFYSGTTNSINTTSSINSQFNQSTNGQTNNEINLSPVKSSIKSSIRNNILMKQKKQQEELRQKQLQQQQNKQQLRIISNQTTINKLPVFNELKKTKLVDEPISEESTKETTNLFSNQSQIESKDNNPNDFELLMECEELADFIHKNEKESKDNQQIPKKEEKLDCFNQLSRNKLNQINEISQIDRIDQLNRNDEMDQLSQLDQLEAKNNLEFNDYSNVVELNSNVDSILNSYGINDLTFDNLPTDNLNENQLWLDENNLVDNDLIDDNLINSTKSNEIGKESLSDCLNTKQDFVSKINYFKNEEEAEFLKKSLKNHKDNTNFLSNLINQSTKDNFISLDSLTDSKSSNDYQNDNYHFLNNAKQSNFFDISTPCNLMESNPILNTNFDQNLSNYFLDENEQLGFKNSYATELDY